MNDSELNALYSKAYLDGRNGRTPDASFYWPAETYKDCPIKRAYSRGYAAGADDWHDYSLDTRGTQQVMRRLS
jgi:hypothetical protein